MLTLPPVKGEISLAGVLPLAGVGGSSRTRVIVVVVVVVVSGRFWEGQPGVFHVSRKLWEAQLVVFYVFGTL